MCVILYYIVYPAWGTLAVNIHINHYFFGLKSLFPLSTLLFCNYNHYTCIHVYKSKVYMYIRTCACLLVCVCVVRECAGLCVCVCVCVCVCEYVCVHVCTYMYVCTVCIHIHVYTFVHVHVHVCVHTHPKFRGAQIHVVFADTKINTVYCSYICSNCVPFKRIRDNCFHETFKIINPQKLCTSKIWTYMYIHVHVHTYMYVRTV